MYGVAFTEGCFLLQCTWV